MIIMTSPGFVDWPSASRQPHPNLLDLLSEAFRPSQLRVDHYWTGLATLHQPRLTHRDGVATQVDLIAGYDDAPHYRQT